jgi:geranylgeranyl diphosphate synthase type II
MSDREANESRTTTGERRGMRILSAADYEFVLTGYRDLMPVPAGTEHHLKGVIDDALRHTGSMARAQLAFAIMRSLGVDAIRARSAAVAVEYFHTASLIFDDLPAMDNATERRGRPCPHLVYGEAAAQLGALALINQAYGLLWGVIDTLSLKSRRRVSELVTASLGASGILDGQARDVHFPAAQRVDEREVTHVAVQKTVPLIRMTLVLPAVIGGASDAVLSALDRLSEVWGLSYQIIDDFKDCLMTHEEAGKSTARDAELGRPNFARATGLEAARTRLRDLMEEARETLDGLAPGNPLRDRLEALQSALGEEQARVESRIPVVAA